MVLLNRLTITDPKVFELEVRIEGCDCSASLDGMSVTDGELWLRRDDGVINVLGDKQEITRE